jgi:hypothetical protein
MWTTDNNDKPVLKLDAAHYSLRNTTFENSVLKIHYRVVTPESTLKSTNRTKVYRWDANANQDTLVAEWEQNWFKGDRILLLQSEFVPLGSSPLTGDEDGFVPLKEVLPVTWGSAGSAWLYVTCTICFTRYQANHGKSATDHTRGETGCPGPGNRV